MKTEPSKKIDVLDTKEGVIRKGHHSAGLPEIFRSFARIKGTDSIEIRAIREIENGKEEVYVEIRLLKEEKKQK